MQQLTGPIVAVMAVLSSVFLPTAFIPGLAGKLYQQFAVTITLTMLLSALMAMSLTPALCALLLRPKPEGERRGFFGAFKPRLQARDRPLRRRGALRPGAAASVRRGVRRDRGRRRLQHDQHANRVSPRRGPGVLLRDRHAAGRSEPRADRRGHAATRGLFQEGSRSRGRAEPQRLRPLLQRAFHRHGHRHLEAVGRAQGARRKCAGDHCARAE